MKMIKSLRNLLVLSALIGFAAHTSVVHAQEPNPDNFASVMVVDVAGIMREASAMQDARKQIRDRQVAYQKEIETRERALRDEEKQLSQQRTLLAADVFQDKQKEFQQKWRTSRSLHRPAVGFLIRHWPKHNRSSRNL